MPIGILFWVLMIISALFGFVGWSYPDGGSYRRHIYGGWGLVNFILFALIGWKVFGPVLQ